MNTDSPLQPDSYQQAWRAQSSQTRVTVDADSLLKGVQLNQLGLRAANVLGACTEIAESLLWLPVCIYMGAKLSLPWTWYLTALISIWSIGLTLVVRARHRRKPSERGEPLLKSVKESLALLEHQQWWLRDHFWWTQLPAAIAMQIFFAHVAWRLGVATNEWLAALGFATFLFVFLVATNCFIYGVDRYAGRVIRKGFERQRQELLALLANLGDETTSEVSGAYPTLMKYSILTSAAGVKSSPRQWFVAILWLLSIPLFAVLAFLIINYFAWAIWEWALLGVATFSLTGFFSWLLRLASRGDETTCPILMGTSKISGRRRFVVILCMAATLFFAVLAFLIISRFAWLAFWKILEAVPLLTDM